MRTTRPVLLFAVGVLLISAGVIAKAQTALQFVPVSPCRLVDTRQTGGPIQGGTSRDFTIPQEGGCNIPSTAAAYSLNVTVVPQGALGFLTIWPAGQSRPTVSTLNSYDGRIKATAAIVDAGTNGAVSVYVSNSTDVILDIDGYFVPAIDSALAFYPVTPCRVADTRPSGGGGPIAGGTSRDFPVQGVGCPIPSEATSYSLNVTAVPNGPLYVLKAWPTGSPLPNISTLNDYTGTVVANAAIVNAGTGGDVSVWVSNDSNLVIDINGYFAPPMSGPPQALSLYQLTPCRVIDTRSGGAPPFTGLLTPPVDVEHSPCAPPAPSLGYVLNATVVPDGALGFLTLWPNGEDRPVASTLNSWDAAVVSNMAIVPTNDGDINAYAGGTTQLILDISGYFAPLPTLSITTTSLPGGTINTPYSSTLAASGGEPTYSWSILSGSGILPPGLGLSSTGVISGTPTVGGVYGFTVQVNDTLQHQAFAMLSITVQTGGLIITTTQLPSGTVNVPYTANLGASGGTPPYIWSLALGSPPLPVGLSLSTGGLIAGTPTVGGASNFSMQVTDSSMPPVMATAPLSITINAETTTAALSGPYAFSFNGYSNGSPVVMAGSFIADGNGNITSGVLDFNNATGGYQHGMLAGTYSIQANGLGTMTFSTSPVGTLVFSVAISNKGISGTSRNGNLIQRDPAKPNSYGSGVILVQNSLNFNLGALQGPYAFGYSGLDPSLKRVAGAGAYLMDGLGGLTNGAGDVDDNGVPSSPMFTGTFGTPDTQSGRGTAALTTNGTVTGFAFYVVSSAQVIMVSTDPIGSADLSLWSIAKQHSTSFTSSFLNGVSVIEVNGTDVVGGNPVTEAEVGLLTTDGQGHGSASIDQNDGGTLNQSSSSGTYSVAANGRVSLSSSFGTNTPILYLVDRNQAFVVGTDSLVTSGILDAQSSPPFGNQSILGTYLGGTVTPGLPSVTNSVSWASADGLVPLGNITLSLTTSGPGGPGSSQIGGTYQVDGTGRGVLTLNGSPAGLVYAVSPQKFIVLPNSATPVLSSFTRGSTN